MSAEVLRRAASLMRERAEHANVNLWERFASEIAAGKITLGSDEHIASWHPAVALAVADWLEHAAARAESKIQHGCKESPVWSHERDALAVARVYLGESA